MRIAACLPADLWKRWGPVAGALAASFAAAQPIRYHVHEVPAPHGLPANVAVALNNAGQVIGRGAGPGQSWQGWRYTPGVGVEDLDTRGLGDLSPLFINDAGQVFGDNDPQGYRFGQPGRTLWRYTDGVGLETLGIPTLIAEYGWIQGKSQSGAFVGGVVINGQDEQRGWVYDDQNGWRTAAEVDPELDRHGRFEAINASGQLVGTFAPPATALLFTPGEGVRNLGYIGFPPVTFAVTLNESGAVGGAGAVAGDILHAVRYTAATGLVDIHTLAPELFSQADRINEAGMLSGMIYDAGAAFRYDDQDGMVAIVPDPENPDNVFGSATYLNASGVVAGTSWTVETANFAWVWTPEGGITYVDRLFNPTRDSGILVDLVGLNDAGQIALSVTNLNEQTLRAYVLTPVAIGDLNCDGSIDAFDIEPFSAALFDPNEYARQHPTCDAGNADVNEDGVVDAFDIEPFVDLLFGP